MGTVRLEHVTKKFGDVVAVNDLSLEVRDEEFLVFVGPSGCGKTTALRMIAGLEEQTSGDIYIGDRLVNDVPPKDRDIAMVFQNYALYPHMDVTQNLAFGLKLRHVAKNEIGRPPGRPAQARPPRPPLPRGAEVVPQGRATLEPRRQADRADARGDHRP